MKWPNGLGVTIIIKYFDMDDRQRIGKRIAELRAKKGLSQAQLGELSGVGPSHIGRIELGKYSVGIDTLAKIGEVLEMELDFNPKEQQTI